MPLVDVQRRPDGVAVVWLNNPPANALSMAVLDELGEAARLLTAEPPGAVVVTGGERIFAAGADIGEFGGTDEARKIAAHFRAALDGIASVPRTVIAAISGYALGGGCELALACDIRVAADTAKLGQPEVLLGIIPGGGGTQRLPRLIGPSRAKDLILSGRQVAADEALRIGLVDRVVPAAQVLDETLAWAAELAHGPVVAHALAKNAIDRGLDGPIGDGLDLEIDNFVQVFATDDARTGVEAFRAKTKPTFEGR